MSCRQRTVLNICYLLNSSYIGTLNLSLGYVQLSDSDWLLRNVREKPKPICKGAEEPPENNSSYATSESETYLKMPGNCEGWPDRYCLQGTRSVSWRKVIKRKTDSKGQRKVVIVGTLWSPLSPQAS